MIRLEFCTTWFDTLPDYVARCALHDEMNAERWECKGTHKVSGRIVMVWSRFTFDGEYNDA